MDFIICFYGQSDIEPCAHPINTGLEEKVTDRAGQATKGPSRSGHLTGGENIEHRTIEPTSPIEVQGGELTAHGLQVPDLETLVGLESDEF